MFHLIERALSKVWFCSILGCHHDATAPFPEPDTVLDREMEGPPDALTDSSTDVLCSTDSECPPSTYCSSMGACSIGCRTSDETCGPGSKCDSDSRTCERTFACCGLSLSCTFELPDDCDGRLLEADAACAPDVCAPQCNLDEDCEGGQYCDVDFACRAGCRMVQGACPPHATCHPHERVCEPLQCEVSEECPYYQFCNRICGFCLDECPPDLPECPLPNVCD